MPLLFSDLLDEWDAALDADDRYRALIEFGRRLPPMDPALKTSATKVPGAKVGSVSAQGKKAQAKKDG